jgi:hypothetical protein
MLPLLRTKQERLTARQNIVQLLQESGGGVLNAVPAYVLAKRLNWPANLADLVSTLMREMLVDGEPDVLVGFNDDGIFLIQQHSDLAIAVKASAKRLQQATRMHQRLLHRRSCESLES